MLEFIVLGQIPGTNIYVSFEWVALCAAGLAIVVAASYIRFTSFKAQVNKIHAQQTAIAAQTI